MRDEFGAFLRSRRARLLPEDVGFGAGARRRVPGLRREEVAALACVSVDYIGRLEQGRVRPSDGVLDALARALRLDVAERAHLFALAGRVPSASRGEPRGGIRPGLLRMLDALEPLPAYVCDPSLDLVAWNRTASLLFGGFERRSVEERNVARMIFLDADTRELLGPPEHIGAEVVAALRALQGTGGRDARVEALVRELCVRSQVFRTLWAEHGVVGKTHGRKVFQHPQMGRIELDWERLAVPESDGLALMVYSAAPGASAATALSLLGTLAATVTQPS